MLQTTVCWLALATWFGATNLQGGAVNSTVEKFVTREHQTIVIERFSPAVGGKHPAIILIHGADSLQMPEWQERYRRYARGLAENGYVVLLPHYMEATGTKWGSPPSILRHFKAWVKALGEVTTAAALRPEVDGNRLGLCGFSLGATLALAQANLEPRIKAVAEFFGPLPKPLRITLKRLPPVLISQGDSDRFVGVGEARKLEKLLKQKHVQYEIKIYAGQGHGFSGGADRDALARTVAFFDKYLAA